MNKKCTIQKFVDLIEIILKVVKLGHFFLEIINTSKTFDFGFIVLHMYELFSVQIYYDLKGVLH